MGGTEHALSLLDDLNNPPKRPLKFPAWLLKQPEEVRTALDEAALDYDTWSDSALEALVRKHGGSSSLTTIRAWRANVAAR